MDTGYVSLSKLPRTKFNCIHLNLYSLQKQKTKIQKTKQFVDRVKQKVTTNPKLHQDRKIRSRKRKRKKEETYNYLLIVFIVTLYSLQKKKTTTRFVDRVEQKVLIRN